MSMREYVTTGKGLVIPEKLIEYVIKHSENFNEEYYGKEYYDFFSDYGTLGGKNIISFIECSGDFFDLDEREDRYIEEDIDMDTFYIIEIDKYPSLYKQAYNNIDEIVEEYKKAVGKYFPEDFDYKKYLVTFIGTYWG